MTARIMALLMLGLSIYLNEPERPGHWRGRLKMDLMGLRVWMAAPHHRGILATRSAPTSLSTVIGWRLGLIMMTARIMLPKMSELSIYSNGRRRTWALERKIEDGSDGFTGLDGGFISDKFGGSVSLGR